jgi:glycosyltransferase involved in cell wall biosynthesis
MTRPPAAPLTVGYVLCRFPVLATPWIGAEMRAVEAEGLRVAPFVFDLRPVANGQPEDAALAARARPVSGLPALPPPRPALRGLPGALRLLRALPPRRAASTLRAALPLAAAARRAGCARLHGHFAQGASLHAMVAARLAGLPVGFTLHRGDFASNFPAPELIGPMLREADLVVAVSPELAEQARACGARRVEEVICGVDPARFAPPAAPPAPNGRLLYFGRLVDFKGVDDLLRALARLDPAARPGLDLVGDGEERAALEALAAALGVDARFLGARRGAWIAAEAPAYLAAVMPFRVGRDGQQDTGPVALKEALALGLPVVTTTHPSAAPIAGDAALLARPGDDADLARALSAMLALPAAARAALGARGRARMIDRFGLAGQGRRLAALFAEAAA